MMRTLSEALKQSTLVCSYAGLPEGYMIGARTLEHVPSFGSRSPDNKET